MSIVRLLVIWLILAIAMVGNGMIRESPGGDLPEHSGGGPVSIHMLRGDVVFTALGIEHPLSAGDVLVFAGGVRHAARSQSGCVFLLTGAQAAPADE